MQRFDPGHDVCACDVMPFTMHGAPSSVDYEDGISRRRHYIVTEDSTANDPDVSASATAKSFLA